MSGNFATKGHAGILLLLFLLVGAAASAQILTGTLTGSVTDPTDARIPGAAVTAVDLGTNRQYETISDDVGTFTLTNLPNGFYRVTVELSGFATFTAERVQVNVAQTARIVARLQVAGVGAEVAVSAEQTVVQTESMELKNAVDRRQIVELPLPTRNPLDLVRTMAGIVTPTGSGIADAFVHGLRGNSTNITHDGINVADNFVKTSSFFALSAPTVDAVGEFNVSVGGVGVDAGFGAAQVSIRTQRGSNDVHGSVYWFQRTNALNANNWFNNASGVARPFQLQNRIGFNVGGPAFVPKVYDGRNRSWFFWNYEAFREAAGATVKVRASIYDERVQMTRSGSSGSLITFQAQGTVVTKGFTLSASYVRVAGFEITNTADSDTNGVGVLIGGSFNEAANNNIHDTARSGILTQSASGNNKLLNNVIFRAGHAGIWIKGTSQLVEGNDISRTIQYPANWSNPPSWVDADGIQLEGSGHVFRRNYIHDILGDDPQNSGDPHIDAFQIPTVAASNITIERNRVSIPRSARWTRCYQAGMIQGAVQNLTIINNIIHDQCRGFLSAQAPESLGSKS